MKLRVEAIVDGDWLIVPAGYLEAFGIQLASPFARMADGAVRPLSMNDAIEKLRAGGVSIGYRRAA